MPAWRPRLALACLALAIRWRPDFVSFKGHRGQRGHVARAAKGYGVLRKLLQLQEEFLSLPKTKDRDAALLDVRSPKEFAQGHVPGAQSLPLLNDDERAAVGTTFVQAFCWAPMAARKASSATGHQEAGQLLLYCKRGGMRSQSMAKLLSRHGFEPTLRWSDGDVWLLK
eukprot:g3252.t2